MLRQAPVTTQQFALVHTGPSAEFAPPFGVILCWRSLRFEGLDLVFALPLALRLAQLPSLVKRPSMRVAAGARSLSVHVWLLIRR